MAFKLYTSPFMNRTLPSLALQPVQIARMSPYSNGCNVKDRLVRCDILIPNGLKGLMGDAFKEKFFANLEKAGGVDAIRASLDSIYAAAPQPCIGLALLCYEDIFAEQTCHRRYFADWWLAKTGETVIELPLAPTAAMGVLKPDYKPDELAAQIAAYGKWHATKLKEMGLDAPKSDVPRPTKPKPDPVERKGNRKDRMARLAHANGGPLASDDATDDQPFQAGLW